VHAIVEYRVEDAHVVGRGVKMIALVGGAEARQVERPDVVARRELGNDLGPVAGAGAAEAVDEDHRLRAALSGAIEHHPSAEDRDRDALGAGAPGVDPRGRIFRRLRERGGGAEKQGEKRDANYGMGTAARSWAPTSTRRPESCAGRRRCVATPGTIAWTSSGITLSRPSSSAQARAQCTSASAARGESPAT